MVCGADSLILLSLLLPAFCLLPLARCGVLRGLYYTCCLSTAMRVYGSVVLSAPGRAASRRGVQCRLLYVREPASLTLSNQQPGRHEIHTSTASGAIAHNSRDDEYSAGSGGHHWCMQGFFHGGLCALQVLNVQHSPLPTNIHMSTRVFRCSCERGRERECECFETLSIVADWSVDTGKKKRRNRSEPL